MEKSKTKLLIVIDAWFPHYGGGQVHVWELSKELTKLGYEITIFTRNLGDWNEKYSNISVVRAGHFKKFSNILGRLEFLILALFYSLRFRYDILSLQAFSPGLLAPFVKLIKPRKKIIFTAHGAGYKISGLGFSGKIFEDLVFYQIKYDLEVTVAKNTLVKKALTKRVVVIPNGVDLKRFSKAIKKRESVKNIIYSGRLVEDKGADLLIRAFTKIDNSGLKLVIVGEGPELKRLKNIVDKSNIIFMGKLIGEELLKMLYRADLMVMPSRVEGQPIRLLEAWAAKLPVLATRKGDNELYIKDKKNGFLTDDDVFSIAKDIERVCSFKELRKVAERGYKDVQDYTWEKIARKTDKLYRETIND